MDLLSPLACSWFTPIWHKLCFPFSYQPEPRKLYYFHKGCEVRVYKGLDCSGVLKHRASRAHFDLFGWELFLWLPMQIQSDVKFPLPLCLSWSFRDMRYGYSPSSPKNNNKTGSTLIFHLVVPRRKRCLLNPHSNRTVRNPACSRHIHPVTMTTTCTSRVLIYFFFFFFSFHERFSFQACHTHKSGGGWGEKKKRKERELHDGHELDFKLCWNPDDWIWQFFSIILCYFCYIPYKGCILMHLSRYLHLCAPLETVSPGPDFLFQMIFFFCRCF